MSTGTSGPAGSSEYDVDETKLHITDEEEFPCVRGPLWVPELFDGGETQRFDWQ